MITEQVTLSVESIYRDHNKRLRKFVRDKLPSNLPSHLFEDIVQETYIRLCKYEPSADPAKIWAYITTTARNVAAEFADRAVYLRPHLADEYDYLEDALAPDCIHHSEDVISHVNQALAALPKRQRAIVELTQIEGLTYQQVATELGLTYRIVLRDLCRAYDQLRVLLAEDLKALGMLGRSTGRANKLRKQRECPSQDDADIRKNLRTLPMQTLRDLYQQSARVIERWQAALLMERSKPMPIEVDETVIPFDQKKQNSRKIDIESNIPLPATSTTVRSRYPWEHMEVMQSFFVRPTDEGFESNEGGLKKLLNRLNNRGAAIHKENRELKYAARYDVRNRNDPESEKGVRVWRVRPGNSRRTP